MKILFAASEANPIIKVGGMADVVGSLAKEIKKAGHDIRIVIPFYQALKEKKIDSLKEIASLKINIRRNTETVNIFQTEIYNGVKVYLLDNEKYLSGGDIYLDAQDFLAVARFLFFSVCILEIFENIDWRPDIIHAHDWQTGAIPFLLKIKQKQSVIRTLFTIHNLLVQGQWNYSQVLEFLGLKGNELPCLKQKMHGLYGDDFNIMQQAIINADLITTVSPGYAKEIKTKTYYARGLDKVIQKRKHDIYGILNGIDIDLFNPKTDPYIKKNYSIKNLKYKKQNKLYLQQKVGFEINENVPLLGVVSRLDVQKGIGLLAQAAGELVKMGCQVVFLGQGQKRHENMVFKLSQKYSHQVAAHIKFDLELAQQIYAGADIFLMPSRFEPCGLSQLIAMRYGTIPIVRATGGLQDTVKSAAVIRGLFGVKKEVEGTGFLFYSQTVDKFITTVRRALKLYSQKKLWRQLQINAMKQDFSWRESAQKYIELYKKILEK